MAIFTALFVFALGMLFVGYPAARMKLRIWKYPGRYPILQKIFFGRLLVGTIESGREDPWRNWGALHRAIHEDGPRKHIGEYTILITFAWPLVIPEVMLGLVLLPVTAIDWPKVIGKSKSITGV